MGRYTTSLCLLLLAISAHADDLYKNIQLSGRGFAVSSNEKGELQAALSSGEHLLGPLPSNYLKYMLAISAPVVITEQEVDHILDWVDATDISIADNHEIPHQLSQKPEKLRGMKALERLSFAVTPETYGKLRLGNFMQNLPEIQVIQVGAQSLSNSQVNEFVANQQPLLNGWSVQLENQDKSIVYRRN